MKIVSTLLFIVCIFGSCNTQNSSINDYDYDQSELKTISVNPKNESPLDYAEIIKASSYLKLETSKNSLIGQIDKIHFDQNRIFIVDKEIAEAIFIYSKEGKFLAKISTKGNAPGEFNEIRDVALNNYTKTICLLDLKGRKINLYDYDGNFKSSYKMPFLFSSFAYIDSTTIAFSTATANNSQLPEIDNHYLITGNIKGTISYKAFPFPDAMRNFTHFNSANLRAFGSKVLYYPRYSDTIYQVQKASLCALYSFDFQGKGIPPQEKEALTDGKFVQLTEKYSYFGGDYVDLEKVALFRINTPKGSANLFYSKKSGKVFFTHQYIFTEPLFNFLKTPIASYKENTVVTWCRPGELMQLKAIYPLKNKMKL